MALSRWYQIKAQITAKRAGVIVIKTAETWGQNSAANSRETSRVQPSSRQSSEPNYAREPELFLTITESQLFFEPIHGFRVQKQPETARKLEEEEKSEEKCDEIQRNREKWRG